MLCFLHIPKCGGSTIRDYIRHRISSQDYKSDRRKAIFVYGKNHDPGDLNVNSDELAEVRLRCPPSDAKAIVGHFSYQHLAVYLGHNNTHGITFSLTRHPISRLISNINYIRSSPKHPAHEFFARLSQENLFRYCKEVGAKAQSTYQLRLLTGLSHNDILDDSDSAINLAKSRIRIYKIENSSAALRSSVFPIGTNRVEIKNATNSLSHKIRSIPNSVTFQLSDFSENELTSLEEIYRPDLRLYQASQ